jgi:ferrous iron transport protein B
MSLIIFYVLAMQCMSTLAVVKRETKSWKWPVIQLVYMTALAYVCSLITYALLS